MPSERDRAEPVTADRRVDERQFHSMDDEIASFRNRRPKTITRPAADKMLRPSAARSYETK